MTLVGLTTILMLGGIGTFIIVAIQQWEIRKKIRAEIARHERATFRAMIDDRREPTGRERLRAAAEKAPPRDPIREAQEREDARLDREYEKVMAISLEPRPVTQHADDTDALIERIRRELNRAEWDRIAQEDRKAGRKPRGIKSTLPPGRYYDAARLEEFEVS